jgi:hypothetical protein
MSSICIEGRLAWGAVGVELLIVRHVIIKSARRDP